MQQAMQPGAQNPQGEEEEIKEGELQLQLILQNSQMQRQGNHLDPELSELTRGGVAAINRQANEQRAQNQNHIYEMQTTQQTKAY